MRPLLTLFTLLAIASCTSPEERAEREAQHESDQCTKAGYQPGTAAFDDCRLQIKAKEDQRAQDRIDAGYNAGKFQSSLPGSAPYGYSMPIR